MEKNDGMQKLKMGLLKISEEIFSRKPGENIDTITNCSEKNKISLGTVQKILTNLCEKKTIKLEKKGKLGSQIICIDYKKILEILEYKFLLCVMPITYSQRYKKLLEKIENNLKIEIPLYFAHMRGGNVRLKLIADGIYHFGVVSKLAAQDAIKNNIKIKILLDYGKNSYVIKHVILERATIKKFINIGIDYESDDHVFLTDSNFKHEKNKKIVKIHYSEAIEKIIDGTIDKVIWNYDDVVDKKKLLSNYKIKIKNLVNNEKNLLATEAVIVTRKDNEIIKNIFKHFYRKNELED